MSACNFIILFSIFLINSLTLLLIFRETEGRNFVLIIVSMELFLEYCNMIGLRTIYRFKWRKFVSIGIRSWIQIYLYQFFTRVWKCCWW